ncbi:prolyl oligopeptidase family serine peptidase [Deinococcus sp. SDU3-2]|uniref:Prolyl oligopeptidase family serine peptidase n=1 Tax=Deinococcus terrestris TaxID=2651870 RepID=A0A7X1NVV1_9DEIO|nr:CocE/NonD family hydrolase [Deinococcus terrestris]MPY66758.1 prolyl oligopeptidase family serine peptidase [Deinococcus terrestris]
MEVPGLSLPDLPGAARLTLPPREDTPRDVTLGGYLWRHPGPAPAALLLHGWGQDASDMATPARLLHAAGWHALSLSLRGWRGSGGCDDYGRSGPGDLGRVLAWLEAQPWVNRTAVLGLSLGGLVALLASAQGHRAGRTVAVNPPADLRGVYAGTSSGILRRYYDAVLTPEQWVDGSPLTHAGHIGGPTWVVIGPEDRICPPELGREFASASGSELLEVAGMGHVPDGEQWGRVVGETLGPF